MDIELTSTTFTFRVPQNDYIQEADSEIIFRLVSNQTSNIISGLLFTHPLTVTVQDATGIKSMNSSSIISIELICMFFVQEARHQEGESTLLS